MEFQISVNTIHNKDLRFQVRSDPRRPLQHRRNESGQERRLHTQQRICCHGGLAILTLSSFARFARRPALFGRAGRFRFRQIIFPGTARTNGKIANLKP